MQQLAEQRPGTLHGGRAVGPVRLVDFDEQFATLDGRAVLVH